MNRGVAQSGRASGLEPEGQRFKSFHPDTEKRFWAVILGGSALKTVKNASVA